MPRTIVDCSEKMRLGRDTRVAGFLGPAVVADIEIPACMAAIP